MTGFAGVTPDVYTHGHHESVLRSHRWRTAENSAAYLLPHLRRGMSLLDVGCGPGTITFDLARRLAPGRVVGVDLSADVIEQAARGTRADGLDDVDLMVGDFHALDRSTFDVVPAHRVLQHLSDPVDALRAMGRLTRPGGIVAVRGRAWRGHRPGVTGWRRRFIQEAAMATAIALDHIVLVVSDVERTLSWYGRHAGLAGVRVEEWRRDEAPFPSLRVDESTIIDLVRGEAGVDRGHLDHICFVVSSGDLDRLAGDSELAVVDRGERFGARGPGQSIYVHDPDGLLVEFRCYPE